ncbi:MAG TPA: alpha/beta hydrolase [Rhizomicrobium sp.]|nr:alpha/beta hydrolase [Rhizomicrobium sp.]
MRKRVPVVMIHGAFCGAWAFASWRAAFDRRGFAVYTPTLRHHASRDEAALSLKGVSLRDYVADLSALIDTLGSPPIVVGHSLGGLLAQILAARLSVRALVLLAPLAPSGVFPSEPFEWVAMQALFVEGAFWNKVVPPRKSIAASQAFHCVPEREREVLVDQLVPESGLALFESMHWLFDSCKTSTVDRHAITCPILCVAGGQDRIVSPATVRRLARRYHGRARYELLPDHGHWLPGEPGWERIAAGSLAWLDQVLVPDGKRVSGE